MNFPKKLSLNQAYPIYLNYPDQRESIRIDIEPLVSYASKFAVIVTEEICEIEKIGEVTEIHKTLIETAEGIVVPSEFGRWMWEKVKDKLFEEVLPEFPNLTYRSAFNRALGNLSMDQRKLLQEKLLQIEIDFRRACNSNLPQNERELLQENLLQIAENLEVGIVFANLSPDEHNLLAQKLWEIAVDLENEKAIPESIDVEGGLTIVCGGIEDDKLVLRRYTNQ